jgi:hypothetical protein
MSRSSLLLRVRRRVKIREKKHHRARKRLKKKRTFREWSAWVRERENKDARVLAILLASDE